MTIEANFDFENKNHNLNHDRMQDKEYIISTMKCTEYMGKCIYDINIVIIIQ